MEFCVHGTNDQPVLILPYSNGDITDITTHTFDEDNALTIQIDFRPEESSDGGGYLFNYDEITIVDPDALFNDILP